MSRMRGAQPAAPKRPRPDAPKIAAPILHKRAAAGAPAPAPRGDVGGAILSCYKDLFE